MTGGTGVVALLVGAVVGSAVLVWPWSATVRAGQEKGSTGPARGRQGRDLVMRLLRQGRGRQRAHAVELRVIDGLAAALEAGLPVTAAVRLATEETGPGTSWVLLGRAATEGRPLGPVWDRLARQAGSPTLGSVARAWRVAELTGAPLADALRVSAHAGRERHRLSRALEVAVAGPRATVTVLTLLPVAGSVLASVLGVGPASLYGSPVSQASLGTGAVLLLAGQAWVRGMVARVVRGVG